jgi:Na+-transporting NADH:ubiquinone oxidoreductase subunit B
VIVTATYFFGLRVLAVLAVSMLFAFLTEWFMASRRGGKVTQACFVTGALYALSLPPNVPFWITAVGIVVGILFGKELFGGFGKNVFNPAIVGRAFVWLSFPLEMTNQFVPVPGLSRRVRPLEHGRCGESCRNICAKAGQGVVDAMTSATPMVARKSFDFETAPWIFSPAPLAGSSGRRTDPAPGGRFHGRGQRRGHFARRGLPAVHQDGPVAADDSADPGRERRCAWACATGWALKLSRRWNSPCFSGALLYAAVFMVTEPVSAPKLPRSQWIYGLFIGMMIVFFRSYGIFHGGRGLFHPPGQHDRPVPGPVDQAPDPSARPSRKSFAGRGAKS